jgi:hypothetical protein
MSLIIRLPELSDPITDSWVYTGHGTPSALFLSVNRNNGVIDGEFESLPNTPDVINSSTNSVFYANGRLFHWSFGSGTQVSIDRGTTWTQTNGLPAGAECFEIIYVEAVSEYQAYIDAGLYVSTNGIDFIGPRATASRILRSPAVRQSDGRIVAIAGNVIIPQMNEYALSSDGGITWSLIVDAGFNTTNGMQCCLYMTGGWIMFGRAPATGNLLIRRSLDGTNGSWNTIANPAAQTSPVYYGRTRHFEGAITNSFGIMLANGNFYVGVNFGAAYGSLGNLGVLDTTSINVIPTVTHRRIGYIDAYGEFDDDAWFIYVPIGSGVSRLYCRSGEQSGWYSVFTSVATSQPNAVAVIPPDA